MKLPKGKIERVCSAEKSRYVFNSVMLDVEKRRLLATDGCIAVVIPCEPDEGDTSGLIPAIAFKSARRFGIDKIDLSAADKITMAKDHKDGYRISIELARPTGAFPSFDAVIPQASGPPAVALSLQLLSTLITAIALGPSTLVGIWPGKDLVSAAYIECQQGCGAIAPMRVGETDLPTMAKKKEDSD